MPSPTNPNPHSDEARASHVPVPPSRTATPPPDHHGPTPPRQLITPTQQVRRLKSFTEDEFSPSKIPLVPMLALDTEREPLLDYVKYFSKSWVYRWVANTHEALLLYEEAQATHYKSYGLLRGHAIDIFRDYAVLRVLEDCAEAVSRSPISYSIDFLLRAPQSMQTPRHSGLIEQMKEKRDRCYELVEELNRAKIALRMRLPGPDEQYELAEQLPDPPQVADYADPMVEPRFSGMYFKLGGIILHLLTAARPASQCLHFRGAGPPRLAGRFCQGAGVQCASGRRRRQCVGSFGGQDRECTFHGIPR